MHCFLGYLLWMGLDRKPKLRDYWRTSELYWSNAAKYMSRNRFEIILRLWHFADNELCPPGDRLHKIQVLVDLLNEKFKRIIFPDENLCIDETMVPFRGRLKFRQYVKGKRHKFGIKLFKLCLPGGFTYHVKIYCGSDKIDGMSVATKVVLELMGDCLGKGATLFTDNWYTSVELAENLLARNTHLVGTLRRNRKGLPVEVVSAKLKKGEIIAREKNGIVVLKWKDKRDVLMLTTKHDDTMTEIPGRVENRSKPQAAIDYNKAKGYIDVSDQLSSYSTAVRRSVKWFRKLAVELLTGASIVNAHYLYNKNNPTRPLTFTYDILQDKAKKWIIPAKWILQTILVWPDSNNVWIICANWLIFINIVIIEISHAIFVFINRFDLGVALVALATVTTTFEGLVRFYMIVYKKHQFNAILCKVWKEFWPLSILTTPNQIKDLSKKCYITVMLSIGCYGPAVLCNTVITLTPYLSREQILKSIYPFPWNSTYTYEIIYVWQYFTQWYLLILVNTFDLFVLPLIMVCIVQFMILQDVSQNIFSAKSERQRILLFGKNVSNEDMVKRCLDQQIMLIKICDQLEDIFSFSLLLQFFSSILALCSSSLILVGIILQQVFVFKTNWDQLVA
ncbi:Transposase IS4 [Popillia japonica]|uniref:Transposase IS4 n=1 Tax=Popillia japonica TaxID=7064 RepID=A0AAW1IYK2_POPJA